MGKFSIFSFDPMKAAFRKFTKWVIKKRFGDEMTELLTSLRHCPDYVIRTAYGIIFEDVIPNTIPEYQRETMEIYGGVLLGFWYRDTAYSDQTDYALLRLLERADELIPILRERVKDPSEWYVNLHYLAEQETKEGKAAGRLLDGEVGTRQSAFVHDWHRRMRDK